MQPASIRQQAIQSLKDEQAQQINWDWWYWGRPSQLVPGTPEAEIARSDWLLWLLQAGRGFGKTRCGAETVRFWAMDPAQRILMIGPTTADVRDTMIEGPSGLLSCYPPGERPYWEPSKHLITFRNGAIGITRSADEPERLRGPQFSKFWADELAAWNFVQEAWTQIMFGFRVPTEKPIQGVITTTPKPIDVIKALQKDKDCVITRGTSDENRGNLSPVFLERVIEPYRGTRIGRQEIEGELLTDTPGALWTQAMIDSTRVELSQVPFPLVRVVVAIDPAVTASETSDETGIGAAGLGANGHVYVLQDDTCRETVGQWGKRACRLWLKWNGDRFVAEVNNGGDLVEANLRSIAGAMRESNPGISLEIPFRAVHATRGKLLRAEPVAAMHERGRIHFVGKMPELEKECTTWVSGASPKSPNRLDWLCWAVYDLALSPLAQTSIVTANYGGEISPI